MERIDIADHCRSTMKVVWCFYCVLLLYGSHILLSHVGGFHTIEVLVHGYEINTLSAVICSNISCT